MVQTAEVEAKIQEAVRVLASGGVVVFPTETAYGLAADATNPAAVQKIFDIKGRKSGKSLPLIADSREMVERYAGIPRALEAFAAQYWPGPLTLVLPVLSAGLVAEVVRDGTVAIRVSSHPVAQALSMGLGKPVVSTSANLAGQPACYRIEDVRAQLGDAPDVYLDGGSLQPQPPSTIVGLDDYGHPEVLREGAIRVPPPFEGGVRGG